MILYNLSFYVVSYKMLLYTIQLIRFCITFHFMLFHIKAIAVQAPASAQAAEDEEKYKEEEEEEYEDDDDEYEDEGKK